MIETSDFQKLFYKLYPKLCQYAYRFITNQSVCEDIVQDCFVKYWETSKRENKINNIEAYLSMSVRNSCISYLRKKTITEDVEDVKIQGFLTCDSEEDNIESSQTDEIEIIKQALALLPEKCRQIFELNRIHNKSYKEIAQILNISTKTVDNQMGKAIKIMRQFIKDNPQFFSLFATLLLYNPLM